MKKLFLVSYDDDEQQYLVRAESHVDAEKLWIADRIEYGVPADEIDSGLISCTEVKFRRNGYIALLDM